MSWQSIPYIPLLLIAAALSVGLAHYAWRRRPVAGATAFMALMLAVAEWSLGYALELAGTGLPTKLFWARMQYLGIVTVPVAWLALVLDYTGFERWLTRRNLALLSVDPLLTLLLAWTNDAHGLIWTRVELDTGASSQMLRLTHGPAFWLNALYSYALLLIGTLLLFRTYMRSPRLYRKQIGIMLLGALVPWAGNAFYLFLMPLPRLDLTPFAFILTGLVVAWGLFHFRLLDIVPIAHHTIVAGMADGVIVLDAQDRIVDLNPAAERIIGRTAEEVIGQPAAQVLTSHPDLVERYRDVLKVQTEITFGEGEERRYYDLRITPLHDRRGRLSGRLILLHDITQRKRAAETLQQRVEQLRIIAQISEALGRAEAVEQICEEALDGLQRALDVDRTAVLLFDPDGVMRFKAWRGLSETYRRAVEGHSPWDPNEPDPQPVLVPDAETDPELAPVREVVLQAGIRALAFIPLVHQGRLLGKFMLYYNTPHRFTEEEVQLAQTIARHIAFAIERRRTEEALRRREAILDAVTFASEEFLKTAAWEENIQEILARLGRAAEVSRVYIFENHLAPDGELLTSQRYEWVAPGITPQIDNPELQNFPWHAGGFSRWVELLSQGELVYGHVRDFPESEREVLAPQDIRSIAVVPVFVDGEWWGFIGFDECTAEREWSSMELDALRTAASTLGAAIQRRRAEQEIRARQRYLTLLNEITLAAVEATDFQTMLQMLADRLGEILDADGCYITLWDEERQRAIPAAAYGPLRDVYPSIQVEPGEVTMTESVLRAERPLVAEDVFNSPYLSPRIAAMFPARSLLGLPLIADGQKLGAALIAFNEPHRFTPEEIARGEQAARQIALAVAKARLLETEREQRQLAEALREASTALTATLEFETVLDRFLDQIVQVVPYDAANVMLVEEDRIRVVRMRGYEQFGEDVARDVANLSFEVAKTPNLRRMAETGKPLVIPDTAADPEWIRVKASDYFRSWAGAPIIVQGKVVAFFSLDKVEPGFYRQEHAERLAVFASQAALAIRNAQLYEEARKRADQMAVVHAIGRQITPLLDVDELLQTAVEALHERFGYLSVQIYLIDQRSNELVARAVAGVPGMVVPGYRQKVGEGITGRAAERGERVLISDVSQDPDFIPCVPGVQSELVLPIRAGDRVVGALNIESSQKDGFDETDVVALEALVGQLSVALENARLFETERRRTAHQKALNAIIAEATSASELPVLLETALDQVLQALGLEFGAIWVADQLALRGLPPDIGPIALKAAQEAGLEIPGPIAIEDWQDMTVEPPWSALIPLMTRFGVRASLTVPIAVGGQRIGGLAVVALEPRAWTGEEIALVETVGRQLGAAAERLQFFQETEERAERMARLTVLSETLNRPFTVAEVVEVIGQGAMVLGNADRVAVYLRHPDDTVTCPWSYGLSLEYIAEVIARAGQLPGGQLLQRNEPVLIPEITALPEDSLLRRLAEREGYHTLALWPLIYEERVIAAVGCYYDATHSWSEVEREVMEAFCRQAAIALENARLFEAVQRRVQEAETLRDIATTLTSTLSLDEILDRLLERLEGVVHFDRCAVVLIEGEYFRVAAARGFPDPEKTRRIRFPVAASKLFAEIRETHRPLVLSDAQADPRFTGFLGAPDVRGWMGVPLVSKGEIIGALILHSRKPDTYRQRDAEIAFAFANQAAIAIENARLFEAAQRRAREAETLREVGAVVTATLDLDEAIERILEQLERVVPYDSASVQLLREGYVEIVGGRGWPDPSVVLGLRFPVPGDNPNTVVIQERRPYILGDAPAAYPPFREDPHSHIRSWLGVPLIVRDCVIGMLTVDSTEPHHFTDEHARLAAAFADQVAIALENARLFQAEQHRREVMATLLEITQVAGSSLELQQVLKRIAQHTARVCQANRCSILLLDETGEYLQPVMSQFADGHTDLELWRRFKATGADRVDAIPLFREAIRQRRPVRLEDPTRTDLLPRKWIEPFGIQKLLVVPLIAHDRVIGLMALDHIDPDREFTPEQIDLALTIGDRVAASVENARLHAAERERARRLATLHRATTALLATLDPSSLLERILESATRVVPAAEKGTLLLVDEETGRLRIQALWGYEDSRVQTFASTFAANGGHAAKVVRRRRPLRIDDTLVHPSLRHDGDIPEVRAIRSALVVPLVLEDRAIGALSLEATHPNAFTDDDLQLLITFAATATTAIRNAQLHAKVQELATIDPLTGLYNRRAFFEMGHREVERAQRFGRPLTAIMFDLDHFKRVNDTYGHAIGDQVLAGLAKLCQKELREIDLLGRYGGEEFAVLLPETDVAGAWQVAERLRRRIAQAAIDTDRGPMQITLSLGIAALEEDVLDLETLLERADRALYAAKQGGRNRTCVWEAAGMERTEG